MKLRASLSLLGCLLVLVDHAVSAPFTNEESCSQEMMVGTEKMWIIDILDNHKCSVGPIFRSLMRKNTPASTFSKVIGVNTVTSSVCAGLIGVLRVAENKQMMDAMCSSLGNDWQEVRDPLER